MMQHSRRTNPYPLTWEIPLAVVIGVIVLLVLGAHTGRGVANLLTGNGWAFPARADLLTTLPALLAGDATAGVDAVTAPASPRLLSVCIIVVELSMLVAVLLAGWSVWSRWGPTRLHGMATAAQAEQLLGQARLRQHAPVIRPDLHTRPLKQVRS